MTDSITRFFDAWGMTDETARAQTIMDTYSADGTYADPRAPEVLTGPDAIADYVAMFSANAPGWTARVVKADQTADTIRVTVAFGGRGPDGSDMVQHGQYFVRILEGKIVDMVGFVGTGAPE